MIYAQTSGGLMSMPAARLKAYMVTQPAERQFITRVLGPAGADVVDAVFLIDPAIAWTKAIERHRRPMLLIIGDDPGTPDGFGGPGAWRCANRLRHWARAAIVHGAGGKEEHYAASVQAALKVGRVVLVETTSRHALSWRDTIRCPQTLLIVPHGGVHPLQPTEAAQ